MIDGRVLVPTPLLRFLAPAIYGLPVIIHRCHSIGRRIAKPLIIGLITAITAQSVTADTQRPGISTAALEQLCRAEAPRSMRQDWDGFTQDMQDTMRHISCTAFINGFISGAMATDASTDAVSLPFCVPEMPDLDPLRRVFLAYTERHPASLGEPALFTIFIALTEAFPCTR
jgi:hypothetical protein